VVVMTKVRIPLMTRCTQKNFRWWSLSVTYGGYVVFSWYFGFPHQCNWPPRYDWAIVESGVKHHNSNLKNTPNGDINSI
jgi:hypothetical protein